MSYCYWNLFKVCNFFIVWFKYKFLEKKNLIMWTPFICSDMFLGDSRMEHKNNSFINIKLYKKSNSL